MAGFYSRLGRCCDSVFGCCVRHPHIPFAVHMHAVRPNEHLGPKALHDSALRVELVDGVVRFEFTVGKHTVETEAASSCSRNRAGLIAADESPDTLSISVHMDRSRWPHFSATRKFCPLTSWNTRAASIREAFHWAIRIVSRSLCESHHT